MSLRQFFHQFEVPTKGRGFYEITDLLAEWLELQKARQGLLVLHLKHTSASLLIQENADPEVRLDLERFFLRLIPDGDSLFQHTVEGEDDMPAHVRTALTSVNLSIPVRSGAMTIGTWQGVFIWEHREIPHRRFLEVCFTGE